MANRSIFTVARVALLVPCLVFLLNQGCAQKEEIVAIKATTLMDGRTGSPIGNVTIVVEGDRIKAVGAAGDIAIPAEAQVIDGSKYWVTPGFVDVHVHEEVEFADLRRLLALGVTSIHQMPAAAENNPVEFERSSQMPETPSPRVHLSRIFTGEFPDNVFPGTFEMIKPTTELEARTEVQKLKGQGFEQIKIVQDDSLLWTGEEHVAPRLGKVVFDALVDEAHALDMRVYVHATQLVDTQLAVNAGADALMHGTMDAPIDASIWEKMRAQKMAWTPAFGVILNIGDYRRYAQRVIADELLTATLSDDELSEARDTSQAETPIWDEQFITIIERYEEYQAVLSLNTRQAQKLGVPIAIGSDGGPSGVGAHLEMEFLQEAGLTPAEVLVAATYGGAIALGVEDEIGTIEAGKLADMVVLNANPFTSIRNARQIAWVIKGGVVFTPKELLADPKGTVSAGN
jgi:imidazolonepropionase-like amidohydrolase